MNLRFSVPLFFAAIAAITFASSSCDGRATSGGTKYNAATAVHVSFSGEKALAHVQAQVDCGPRPAGSPEIEAARLTIEESLAALGWVTQRQEFSDPTPRGRVKFANVRARFPSGENEKDLWSKPVRLLLGSHYDTKRYLGFTFVGANDAGSSTGALIEMARCLVGRPELASAIELVFFDGEECFIEYSPTDGLYGSRHYASNLRKTPKETWPEALVLLDMVGDKDLKVGVPTNSSKELLDALLAAADAHGTRAHFAASSKNILDDHQPFLGIGMKAIDVIDLDYPAWHTSDDVMSELSAESLQTVGQTVLLMIEKHLLGGVPVPTGGK